MIIVLTANQRKFQEYQRILGRYGFKVEQQVPEDGKHVSELFENPKTEYVLRETSDLYNATTNDFSSKSEHLEAVYNQAELTVYARGKLGRIIIDRFSHRIDGYIDFTRRAQEGDVFDWDDLFVVLSTQLTYHEMRQLGIKTSSRDLVLADFFKKYVHYDRRVDLKFSPQNNNQTVEFSDAAIRFVRENKHINAADMAKYRLDRALNAVIKGGIFFRSASNRREKNYWSPGLNGGLPLTPKKDDVHEVTFMFHDLMHFLIPDLVFTGEATPLQRQVYITYRMISEAVTLVMADMLFIDSLSSSGLNYDFSTRRIHPVFQSLNVDFETDFLAGLKTLLFANVRYALMGDDQGFKDLMKDPSNTEVLELYKEKYQRYFIEDYRWTDKNFDNMLGSSRAYISWINFVGRDMFKRANLYLLDEFTNDLKRNQMFDETKLGSVIKAVFDQIFTTIIKPAFSCEDVVSDEESISSAFQRYMIAQLMIFSKYSFATGAQEMGQRLIQELRETKEFTLEKIEHLRSFYNLFVDQIYNINVISQDDQHVFKEIHPLYDPFYVFYEAKQPEFMEIESSAETILNLRKAA